MRDLEALNPDLAQQIISLVEAGTAHAEAAAHDQALAAYEHAWSLLPEDKTQWHMLSNWVAECFYESFFQTGSFAQALQWANTALQNRESEVDVGPWMNLGKVHYELDNHAEAFRYFKSAFDFGQARVFKEHPKVYYDFFKRMNKTA